MTSSLSPVQKSALACRTACEKISHLLEIVVSIPVTVLLVSLVTMVGYSVFARYCLGNPPAWTEEVSLFMIIAVVFTCLCVTFKRGQQIGVTLFIDKLPRFSFIFALFSYAMSIFFLGFVAKQSFQGATFFAVYKAPSTGISFYWLYITMSVGCALAAFEVFLMAIQRCCNAILPKEERVFKN